MIGLRLGAVEGLTLGKVVGSAEGCCEIVGIADGDSLAVTVGGDDGANVGTSEGDELGIPVGLVLGRDVGVLDGDELGLLVGRTVGAADGEKEGVAEVVADRDRVVGAGRGVDANLEVVTTTALVGDGAHVVVGAGD